MKIHLHPYLFICLLFMIENCPAQTQQVRFNLVSGSNGNYLGKINGITRDPQGVMWFSDQDHQCIIRYDGTLMTSFPYDPKNSNSLGGRYPECILADSTGIIWIGFTGSGLDRFDPGTNTFTHFRHQANDTGSLASDIVSALLVDHLGNLWVGNNGGLDLLNKKTGKFKHFISNELDSTSLSDSIVRAIYEDHEGTLWIGTGFPWMESPERGGLNRFNRGTGTFTRFLNDPKNPHSLINNKVRAIFEDSRGIFWVGTGGDGLHSMERKTGVFERYTYNPAKPEQLSRPPVVNNIGDHITFITEDALGNLWIGTFGNGLIRYDTGTKKITHYGNNTDGSGTFMDNSGWCANTSKDGLIWISTQESHLYRVDIFTNYFPRFETGVGSTNAFYQEEPGVLWLGTYNGLIRKNTRNGNSRRFTNESTDPGNTGINSINGIIKDKQGDFFISSYGGISRFNPNTGLFTRFEVDPSIKFSIRSNVGCLLYMDSRSNLWFGTNDALHFLDRETGKYIHYNHVLNDSNSLSSAPVVFMMEEENGLWVGTYYAGLSRLNRQTGKFRHYLSVAYTTCIYRDLKGIIWVGTGNGLYRYNQQSDTFSIFDEGHAGIKIDNVSSLIGDDQDNLWIASASGIYRINQTRDQIILYDKKNGVDRFASQLYWGVSSYKGLDGEIFFSSSSGYYAFYPDKLKIPPAGVQTIELSRFWLKGLDVEANPDGPLTKPLSKTKEIRLKHDQNVFSLSFTATDYANPEDKTFYYKLENYDEDWRLSGVDEKAYYFNVPPGKYVFRVKVSNNTNGATAEKGTSIIISPPWWQTWWTYSLYALLMVIAVISIDRMQKKKVIRKARELGRERELEMQALRAQMNPHFIFNCLSSINNFVLKNETEEASDYLTKFSRLIRTVLNNSKKSFIPLEDELDMLRLYLEMETLRFKGSFTYFIHLDKKIDPFTIFIPPLLIQPFVENAIWHGLLHKADPGRLDISVKVEKNILICIIEDNGVGRSFARVSESKSVEKKKSMGIQITRQRLSLINGNAEIAGNDFVIEDLIDDIGHAAGTKVILRLMYKEINDEII